MSAAAQVATLVGLEARKAARQPTTWVLGIILVGLVAMVALAFSSLLRAPADTPGVQGVEDLLDTFRQDVIGFGVEIFGSVAALLFAIFAATLIGQEYSRSTLRTLLLNRASRLDVAGSKYAFVLASAALLALVGIVAALLLGVVFGFAAGEDLLKLGERGAGHLARTLAWRAAGLFLAFATWGGLAFALTLAWRSLGAGIGGALAMLLVGDTLGGLLAGLGDVGLYAARVMPNTALAAVSRAAIPDAGTWAWVAPNLVAYAALVPALAMWRFRRVDVLAATK